LQRGVRPSLQGGDGSERDVQHALLGREGHSRQGRRR
jgi:hypothetical protein